MFSNRLFQISFLVSLFIHGTVLFQGMNFNFYGARSTSEKLELRYVKDPEKEFQYQEKKPFYKDESFLKVPAKIIAQERIPPPFIDKERLRALALNHESRMPDSSFAKPLAVRPDVIAIKKRITLPAVDLDKIDNPSYISYYQIVREKIRRAAYQHYSRTETGEVYLSFIISADGSLQDIRLVAEKSSAGAYLQEIGMQSIKDASPFPNFPKELDYPQLSFNVIISFEIE